ncbi:hypothetical protein IFO69_19765 [Echinicola sp. CAU 1574]|uniref:Uncharacterized protein n=1 Tax=Echinicola arenosa TaxID=2774144 RepID=A0ABR9ASW6_9BACT|nr:hypothetical protein [Echinicola arenosa]MBD8491000.1 hypothetical protein [Echinicola arenosa]
MKKETLIIISTVLILLSFWLGMKVERELASWDEIGKPVFEKEQIYFPNKKTSLYLKSKNWGLTADHKISVISTKSDLEFQPDSISEYIFHGFGGIIYKMENDTLKIYSTQKPKTPPKFESDINVEIIEIKDNLEWIKLNDKIKNEYQKF